MLPDPLHPAVVHLPLALAALIPAFAILGAWLIYRKLLPSRSWLAIVVLQALLAGSAWAAMETGEREEDRVERIVAERPIEDHEEAGERFLFLAGLGLLATGAGLLPGRNGSIGRVAATAATVAVLAAGVSVGHSGGELVYKHGAANAYLDSSGTTAAAAAATSKRTRGHDDD